MRKGGLHEAASASVFFFFLFPHFGAERHDVLRLSGCIFERCFQASGKDAFSDSPIFGFVYNDLEYMMYTCV